MKRDQYDKDMYDEKRRNGELAAARNDGRAEGHAEGKAEGIAEGLEKGREEGKAEGLAQGQTEIAKKMLEAGMAVEQVIQFTGLDRETVEKL